MNIKERQRYLGYNEELERNQAGGHGVEGRAEIHWVQLEMLWRENLRYRVQLEISEALKLKILRTTGYNWRY